MTGSVMLRRGPSTFSAVMSAPGIVRGDMCARGAWPTPTVGRARARQANFGGAPRGGTRRWTAAPPPGTPIGGFPRPLLCLSVPAAAAAPPKLLVAQGALGGPQKALLGYIPGPAGGPPDSSIVEPSMSSALVGVSGGSFHIPGQYAPLPLTRHGASHAAQATATASEVPDELKHVTTCHFRSE
ncbi:unnamed protein product [Prorocentrum cordatum]|uniref:Uncharacterized protein n=1 Tax=Prorocentrum cordatum TaxID=2364126 RepID=A0ABN9Q9N7_9DINO|nr:unnamed protein product [Polarella glacialis]